MNRPLLVIGSAGMLGRALVAECARRGIDARAAPGKEAVDVSDEEAVRNLLYTEAPRLVINATGYTDVDGAEEEPAAADQVNRVGADILARMTRELGALLIHYSTDYVFDGRASTPYRVDDPPNPSNVYGTSKLAGERAVVASGCRYLLLRTSWLFAPHGRNFVRTILEHARVKPTLDVVDDQYGRPTYAADLARMTLDLVDRGAEGVFHAANGGQCSWYELAAAIGDLAGLECEIRPCPTSAHPRPALRPGYSVLDLSSTVALIGEPRPWRAALADCLEHLGARHAAARTPGTRDES